MKRTFTKIKFKQDKVFLTYTQKNSQGKDDAYSVEISEAPAPGFTKALENLAQDVLTICELPTDEDTLKTIKVLGVSISHTDTETEGVVRGFTISALKDLKDSNSPLVLNTPHKPEAPYSKSGDNSNCLYLETVERIDTLIEEAEKYLKGHRAQVSMGFDEKKAA